MSTKDKSDFKAMPQEKNQTAIYRQVDEWIRKRRLKELYAEGCSGELNAKSSISFNGWNIADLKKISKQSNYPEIVTSVPLKLEAKYDKAVLTVCGDDPQLVKENSLAFSDARGTLGFLTRIVQYKNDPVRLKTYLDGALELYKLPPDTTADQVIIRLKAELKSAVKRANSLIEKRNAKLVQLIKKSTQPETAVIYGGMHAAGLLRLLNDAGIDCSVVEPAGYQDNEVNLMERLEDALKTL